MYKLRRSIQLAVAIPALMGLLITGAIIPKTTSASSHDDAPLLKRDPAANTTDVYAFVTGGGTFLNVSLGTYPHQEPGIGPNQYNFDDDVLYEIHIATGSDVAAGRATFSYQFQFNTAFKDTNTILEAFRGVIQNVDDASQNLTQTYTVTRVDNRPGGPRTMLGTGKVPPNNQGRATPFYNVDDNGDNIAKDGVDRTGQSLDRYTAQSIFTLSDGSRVFAGQRADAFYFDGNAVFDLLSLRGGADRFDSQSGFNINGIGMNIPISTIGGDRQIVGVYATTSRRATRILRSDGTNKNKGPFVQVGRQGNPVFCEALVAVGDKDLYNRSKPSEDNALFRKYAESPELARLINAVIFRPLGIPPMRETGRADIAGIFIPDLIKVDLSTGPARLAGGGPDHPTNPDDLGFSRLGIFGVFVPGESADVLTSKIPGAGFLGNGTQPGGWPNGRRFDDDVVDIALLALASDLSDPLNPKVPGFGIPAAVLPALTDGINKNDEVVSKILPYWGTPHNGRNYRHNPQQPPQSRIIN